MPGHTHETTSTIRRTARRARFEAELVGGEMVITRRTKAQDGTPSINREVYHAIVADQFEIRTEVSLDEGVSWRPGGYSLVASRIRNTSSHP